MLFKNICLYVNERILTPLVVPCYTDPKGAQTLSKSSRKVTPWI